MRVRRGVAIAVIAVALVVSSVPVAFAHGRGDGWAWGRKHLNGPYRVSSPSVPGHRVTMGVAFESTGVVLPAFAADDASTTVAVQVYGSVDHERRVLLDTLPASLTTSPDASGTTYSVMITLPAAGEYSLVAVVSYEGTAVSASRARELKAVLPFRISKPSAARKVGVGESFDASVTITPVVPSDDPAVVVTFHVYQAGRHGRLSEVASVTAAPTGPVAEGTGYSVTLSLPSEGRYVLVAVLTKGGVVVGKSCGREVRVVAPPVAAPALPALRRTHHGR